MTTKHIRDSLVVLLALFLLPAMVRAQSQKAGSGFVTTAEGLKIHYLQSGPTQAAAPAILFVPGWTMPAWIWEKQIDHFSKTHRVIAMDPRGQGESSKPTEGYFPAARARDIMAVVDNLKLAPVVLVGWSMGVGKVVSYVDQFGTKDLAGIVLVDGIAGTDSSPEMTTAMLGIVGNYVKDREKVMAGFIPSMYKTPQTEAYIRRVTDASRQTPTSAGATLFLGMITTDNRPALAKIDKPTLICTAPGGPWDALYDDMQKRITGSRLEKFDGAGHALFVDAADKFNAILDEFLKSLTPKR